MVNEKKENAENKEFGTIKITRTDDGFRLDVSGDMIKNCCCCGPGASDDKSESDCCSTEENKSDN